MDACQRTRKCVRTRNGQRTALPRGAKQICVPMNREAYDRLWQDATAMRQYLDELLTSCPELFPTGIEHGLSTDGMLAGIEEVARHTLAATATGRRTAFSRCGPASCSATWRARSRTSSYPLLLLSFGVPTWVVTRGFGHNDMYWHRLVERLGRNSLAGTTVRKSRGAAAASGGRRAPCRLVRRERIRGLDGRQGLPAGLGLDRDGRR